MSAFLIAMVQAHSLDWVSEYSLNVPAIVRRYGGEYLAVSGSSPVKMRVVEGTGPVPDGFAIMKFPSLDTIDNFLNDPEYAPYKEARQAGTLSTLYAFENEDAAPQFTGQKS